MFVPSTRQIRRLTQNLRPNPVSDHTNSEYLKSQFKLLKPYEKYVFLKIDEISLTPSLDFQGEQVLGYADQTKNAALADSCQAFLICSMLSQYQDVVKLVPVKNQTSAQLANKINNVLDCLHEIGFVVLAITSDNHSTNRKMIFQMCGGNLKIDTKDRDHKYFKFFYRNSHFIHFFFDAPHIFKCIRNN